MPLYDIRCTRCDKPQETFLSMREAVSGQWPSCEFCGASTHRAFYAPPADHSENTHKPYWCENLSEESGKKVYVGSRAEETRLMNKMGVFRAEPGMAREYMDKSREKRENDRKAAARELTNELRRRVA